MVDCKNGDWVMCSDDSGFNDFWIGTYIGKYKEQHIVVTRARPELEIKEEIHEYRFVKLTNRHKPAPEAKTIILYREWYETNEHKTGWDTYGWTFDETGGDFVTDIEKYEMIRVIDTDKYGHETKAEFKIRE